MDNPQNRDVEQATRTMQRIGILSGAVVLCGILAQSTFFTVKPGETALVARLGRLDRTVGPGLHFQLPFGIDYVEKVSTEEVRIEQFGVRSDDPRSLEQRSMITRDSSIVEMSWALHYQVKDPVMYVSSLREPDRFLRDTAESIVRTIVGKSDSSELLGTSGQAMAAPARDQVQLYLDKHEAGITVSSVVIHEIIPPTAVKPAFDGVDAARQEREEIIGNARQAAAQRLLEANGQAAKLLAGAEVEALARSTQALREINAFYAAHEAFKANPDTIKKAIYLDTMRSVLPKAGKIIVVQDDRGAPQSLVHLNEQASE